MNRKYVNTSRDRFAIALPDNNVIYEIKWSEILVFPQILGKSLMNIEPLRIMIFFKWFSPA